MMELKIRQFQQYMESMQVVDSADPDIEETHANIAQSIYKSPRSGTIGEKVQITQSKVQWGWPLATS